VEYARVKPEAGPQFWALRIRLCHETMKLIRAAATWLSLPSLTTAFTTARTYIPVSKRLMGSSLSGSVDDEVKLNDENKLPPYVSGAKAAEALGHPYFYGGDAKLAELLGPIRHFVLGDMTVGEMGYFSGTLPPRLDDEARASNFFASGYFYGGNDAMARLYQPIREEKFGMKTVGEVMRPLVTEGDFFDCFLMVGVPRAAVGSYRRGPPADNYRFVPSCNGDEKAKDFFSHPLFYYWNEYAAELYAEYRNHLFGDKSVYEFTRSYQSYEELETIFAGVGIRRGIQIIQYHPTYAGIFSSPFFVGSDSDSKTG
jgi:hypothetical protein